MQSCPKTMLIAAILFACSASIAQEAKSSADSALMARLSYDNSVRRVCLAVSKDGDYRIVRSLDDGQTQRLHGKMPKEEFRQLTDLLEASDFRNLSGNGSGLVRRDAETFAAEIALHGRLHDDGHGSKWLEPESWHLRWLNGDGEAPFPTPVVKVVDWMKAFEPKNAKRFENTEIEDVCPSVGLSLVQPSISENLRP